MQNPILAALKIIVMTAFAVLLGLDLFATQNLEEKILRTRETLDKVSDGVAETNRRVDGATEAARNAKEAADRSYERLNALLDAMDRGIGVHVGEGGDRPPKVDRPPDRPAIPTGDVTTEPSVIAGKKVYPRNPGWTVLCDKDANDDPKRAVPRDQIDRDGVLNLPEQSEPKGLNYYSDDRTVTLSGWAHLITDQLAMRKSTDIKEWNAMLAERVEESPDRTQYMIYLRKGVRWHRPTVDLRQYPWLDKDFEVTASDVKFTIDMILDPNAICPLKVYFDEITDVEIIDRHTLKISWKRPNFYARATTLEIMPLPDQIYPHDQ